MDLCSYRGREFAFRPAAKTRGFMETLASQIAQQLETLKVLVVDDEASMRKVTRALLQASRSLIWISARSSWSIEIAYHVSEALEEKS